MNLILIEYILDIQIKLEGNLLAWKIIIDEEFFKPFNGFTSTDIK
jgi:hypothetical protein